MGMVDSKDVATAPLFSRLHGCSPTIRMTSVKCQVLARARRRQGADAAFRKSTLGADPLPGYITSRRGAKNDDRPAE